MNKCIKSKQAKVKHENGLTGGEDAYIFVDHPGRYDFRKGRKATLSSPFITGPVCMKFYFYLRGENNGYLYIRTTTTSRTDKTEQSKKYGNHGHKWNFVQIFLDFAPTDIYQVSLNLQGV